MSRTLRAGVAAFALAACASAHAQSFTGSTVHYQYYFPNLSTPNGSAVNVVVGPGVEIPNVSANVATMDISANNILIQYGATGGWTSGPFNGWVLSDQTNNLAQILGVTIDPATNLSGFSTSNLSFTGDSITVNWQSLNFDPSTVVSLDVAFAPSDAAVPEPSTWAMMLLGFAAIEYSMRRASRRNRQRSGADPYKTPEVQLIVGT